MAISMSQPGVKFIQSMARADLHCRDQGWICRNSRQLQASRRSSSRGNPPQPWRKRPRGLSAGARGHFEDDEDDDDELEERRPPGVDLAANHRVGLREQRLLGVDARLPGPDAEPPDGALVDAREVEVADDLERVVDALGELAELHEAADHAVPEVDPRVADDVRDAPRAGAIELAVDVRQLRVEQLVVVAELEELRRRELEDVGDVAAARRLEDERAVPVHDDQVVLEVAVRVRQHVFRCDGERRRLVGSPRTRLASDRRGEHLLRRRIAVESTHEDHGVRLDGVPVVLAAHRSRGGAPRSGWTISRAA